MTSPGSYVSNTVPVAVPIGYSDPGRSDRCWPSQPLAAAKFDREKLACFYKSHCFLSNDEAVRRTFLDVYPQGVLVNTPQGACCCLFCDNAHFLFYDDAAFSEDTVAGGFCSPPPYLCTHCLDMCGEVLVFRRGTFGCPAPGFHHQAAFGCCCPINVLYGLAPGEGKRVSQLIADQKQSFTSRGGLYPQPVVSGGGYGTVGSIAPNNTV